MTTETVSNHQDDMEAERDTKPRETHARPDCQGLLGVDAKGRFCLRCGDRITSMHQIHMPKMTPASPPYGSLYTPRTSRIAAFLSVLACVSVVGCSSPTQPSEPKATVAADAQAQFQHTALGTVRAHVSDREGRAIAGAYVHVLNQPVAAYTDSLGVAVLHPPLYSRVHVLVKARGYGGGMSLVDVVPQGNDVNFPLYQVGR